MHTVGGYEVTSIYTPTALRFLSTVSLKWRSAAVRTQSGVKGSEELDQSQCTGARKILT